MKRRWLSRFFNCSAGASAYSGELLFGANAMRSRAAAIVLAISSALISSALAAFMAPAAAESQFPSRPVKFIIPFLAGGSTDVLARIVGDKLQTKWGWPVIVENRAGAGGNIGADAVAKAEPDGHTLLVTPPGPLNFFTVCLSIAN
jgi:tripartite-type tricarboxylate transporter receptor subunit TctC